MIRAILDYLKLKKHQKRFSTKRVNALQLKMIQDMVTYAQANSPFYQELYINKSVENMEDFYTLPTINKTIMMDNFSRLNTENIDINEVMTFAIEKEEKRDYEGYFQENFVVGLSSGTSGNKGLYLTPKSLTKRLPAVFLARSGLSLTLLPLRILFLLRVFSQGFNDINAPFIKLKYLSTMTPLESIVEAININKINILMAPPSLLRFLITHSEKITVKLKKIITYAEVLTQEDKIRFEKAFQTKVIEIYQASEGQIASPCHKGKLHINEDLVYIELYDQYHQLINKPNIISQKMIVTNLVNKVQPLIRYHMNDMIVLDEPCSCGSSFRTIKQVIGRHDDLLYFTDKDKNVRVVFPDLFARWIITTSDVIREFQVHQNAINEVEILIDVINSFNTDILKNRLELTLSEYGLTGKISIRIQSLKLPENYNKYKRFVNTISPDIIKKYNLSS